MKKVQKVDTRLSSSSATTLRACEQKWFFYKVEKRENDSDYSESDSLMIGKAFHSVIEQTKHKYPRKIVPYLKDCTGDADIKLDPEYYPLIIGMVYSYTNYLASTDLTVVDVEIEIGDEEFLGYVDAVFTDNDDNWWISDNKTWAYFSPSQAGQLANHVQMNLYASFAPQIAEMYDLDMKKFKGCRIMATTKPKNKQGKLSRKEWAEKLKDLCMTWDIEIPTKTLNPKKHLLAHKWLHDRADQLREGHDEPNKNYDHCMSYYSPCQYWSGCHGCEYSKSSRRVKVRGGI